MSSDPKIIVQKFLQDNGYPFEMLVARELQKAGFHIQQSTYYLDLNTKIPREIDIIATWHQELYILIEKCTRFLLKSVPLSNDKNRPFVGVTKGHKSCWTWRRIIRSYYFISGRV